MVWGCLGLIREWMLLKKKSVLLPEIQFDLGRSSLQACGHLQMFPHLKAV